MALSRVVSEIYNVAKRRDLEIGVSPTYFSFPRAWLQTGHIKKWTYRVRVLVSPGS